ncbi:MAG: methyltransferase domain-containing protein [Halobacteriaceae archaeon]
MIRLVREDREFLCAPGEELHTDLGVVQVPVEPEPGDTVESHLGEPFEVQALRGPDLFEHMARTGAPMMPRDIGLILGATGACKGDHILDAGTGTGVLAAYLGRLGATVDTYEIDTEKVATARENMKLAGVTETVSVHCGDITEAIDALVEDSDFDVLTLDTEDAPAVVRHAPALLAPGGYAAVYSPFIEQAREIAETARDVGLDAVRTQETIQRRMDFDERGTRPTTRGVGHTGYLTFARA